MDGNPFPRGQTPAPLELAYVGDTVWDLYVRTRLVRKGGRMKALHRTATSCVCAAAQSEALERIEGMLDGEEIDVVRRARNARQTPTKNADPADYHRATALEALIGWLYMTGRTERMRALMDAALPQLSGEEPADKP